jgi:hAT family C-terminal dimerisation region/Protein of unknown function (DUF 659)
MIYLNIIRLWLLATATGTPDIPTSFPRTICLDKQWTEMVAAFVKAGIPLNVFSNDALRTWMTKYVKNGDHLPSTTTLRVKLDTVATEDKNTTIEMCQNKDICVTADETTDILARKVLNILVKPLGHLQKSRLITTTFLEKADADTVVEQILAAVTLIKRPPNSIVVLCSDNAPYMIKAGENLKKVSPRLLHTTCWSHILHLAAEEIRAQMPEADELVAGVKKALIKAPARKAEFLEIMAKYDEKPGLPPIPVITRWTTWLHAGSFHWAHLKTIFDWIPNTTDNSPVLLKLKRLLASSSQKLAEQLERINEVYPGLSSTIKTLEGESVVSSEVWSLLNLVRRYMESLGIPSDKLTLYLNSKHPAIDFWTDVQILDPRKCPDTITRTGLPQSLCRFSNNQIPFSELLSYRQLSDEEVKRTPNIDVPDFWRKYAREMPHLSDLALKAISVPASSADVERSFSYLKKILTPQRTNLIEKNLDAHIRLAFNTTNMPSASDDYENYDTY